MELEKRIDEIEKRNKRVELDKRWETSFTRRACIAVLTYLIVVLYSYLISKNNNIFLSSLVPVIGFLLSTLSLRLVRNIWQKNK
jgi:polyferredoxin